MERGKKIRKMTIPKLKKEETELLQLCSSLSTLFVDKLWTNVWMK